MPIWPSSSVGRVFKPRRGQHRFGRNIGYHLQRRHRSSRGVKRKKQNLYSFIVASFNAQSVKGNDMACKRCEITTFIKDNGVDLYFVTETWLSAQGDEAKTFELAPSGFDVNSFPRQSRSRGGGIATVYKSTFGSNITFKTNFDFTHTSFEVVQASITLQHNTLHFFLSVPTSTKPKKQPY